MEKSNNKSLIGLGLLLITAFVWGFGFVAQSIGADYVGAYTFLAVRNWISFFLLIPVIRLLDLYVIKRGNSQTGQTAGKKEPVKKGKKLWIAGLVCGVFLFAGSATQQIGIAYTTAAKAGFLTSMYVVIVPVIYAIIKKGIGAKIWISVILAVAGLYLLCIKDGFSLGKGDTIVLICALFFALQILFVDKFVPEVDAVRLSQFQFLVVAILSTICMFVMEKPTWESIYAALPAILYAGIVSSGVGYTLQIVGQTMVSPTVGGITMSLESVFAAIGGWLVLGQLLTRREFAGCAVMFAAIILAQIPIGYIVRRKRNPGPETSEANDG
ncbi:MAG: DMT family transporter [Eubacterium sp.]|nr:DMT family transporter [Eubacterium sp.]